MRNPDLCRIRRYRHADLPSLTTIYASAIRHLGPLHYSPAQVRAWSGFCAETERFKNWIEHATTFVAVSEDGRCAGFGGLENDRHIASLFVAPDFQRSGIASRLLTRLLEEARTRGANTVTAKASEFSKPLFEKFGFEVQEIEHTERDGVELSRYAMHTCI